ncbi:DUF3169 family protein [Dysosmobacter sp.]|uniref:DUF3169 family protein n=1 Tax=Dysosmobacter sp. TaxID=2591382 RepID=UPI002A84F580|nr:DUF3169 family protein [Dysosmobacter sp.]MDY3282493.1 DUF3169 family protein [Dysosmobacter sp.]
MSDSVKQDNRKALPRYLLVIFCSAILGGVLGFLSGWYGHSGLSAAFAEGVTAALRLVSPWGIPVCTLVLLGTGFRLYRSAKRDFAGWDGEDDALMDALDRRLNWTLLLITVTLLLDFFFLSAATAGIFHSGDLAPIWIVLAFIPSIFLVVVFQQRVIDLVRQMNPEKQGSVYDLHFRKKWLDSCDEAERREIGEAAYQAFIVTNSVCPFLWLAMILLNFVFRLGLMPSAMVLLVWGCLQVSYTLACIRIRSHSTGGSIGL